MGGGGGIEPCFSLPSLLSTLLLLSSLISPLSLSLLTLCCVCERCVVSAVRCVVRVCGRGRVACLVRCALCGTLNTCVCRSKTCVCRSKTSPCVPVTRPHTVRMWAFCQYTRRRFDAHKRRVLHLHTEREVGRTDGRDTITKNKK